MSKRKRKAKDAEEQPKEEPFAWKPGSGGILKGTKFRTPPCPEGTHGYHQYEKIDGTRNCRVWRCRLCDRTLGVNRDTGNVRERSSAPTASTRGKLGTFST